MKKSCVIIILLSLLIGCSSGARKDVVEVDDKFIAHFSDYVKLSKRVKVNSTLLDMMVVLPPAGPRICGGNGTRTQCGYLVSDYIYCSVALSRQNSNNDLGWIVVDRPDITICKQKAKLYAFTEDYEIVDDRNAIKLMTP